MSGLYTFPMTPRVSDWAKDLIKKLLQPDPKLRIGYQFGCAEIKKHAWFKNVNFAVVYPPALQVKTGAEAFQQIPREGEQMAKEFAGTQFKLPDKANQFVPQALKLLEQAGLPLNPKPIDILQVEEITETTGKDKQVAATYQGKKPENKRAGLAELFGGMEKKKPTEQKPTEDKLDKKEEMLKDDKKKVRNEDSV